MAPRQQILAGVTPVQTQHPAAVTCEVCDLLAGCDVVQGDDARVATGCEELGGRRERDGADGMDEAGEGVCEAACVIVEDVDGAVFVAGGREAAVAALQEVSVGRRMSGNCIYVPGQHTARSYPSSRTRGSWSCRSDSRR